MLYRPYQPADFPMLYAVEKLCFEPPFRFSRAYMRALVRNPNAATWIVEENSELAGFAIVEWLPDEDPCTAYIQTIEVHPAWRCRGIAANLLRHVENSASAAGVSSIWLHVDTENAAAVHLYEAHGYARKGREEHYYARTRAAFVYAKRF